MSHQVHEVLCSWATAFDFAEAVDQKHSMPKPLTWPSLQFADDGKTLALQVSDPLWPSFIAASAGMLRACSGHVARAPGCALDLQAKGPLAGCFVQLLECEALAGRLATSFGREHRPLPHLMVWKRSMPITGQCSWH